MGVNKYFYFYQKPNHILIYMLNIFLYYLRLLHNYQYLQVYILNFHESYLNNIHLHIFYINSFLIFHYLHMFHNWQFLIMKYTQFQFGDYMQKVHKSNKHSTLLMNNLHNYSWQLIKYILELKNIHLHIHYINLNLHTMLNNFVMFLRHIISF